MGYVPDDVVEELSGSHQLGVFVHIATDPPLRVWLGVNDIPIQIDSLDGSGATYRGAGRLIGVPTLETLVNGAADSVDFTLSGIDPSAGAAIIDSLPEVRGADVYVGITTLDQYYQPMSSIIPLWRGIASHTTEASPTVTGFEDRTLTLGLTVASGEKTRSRPSRSLWSSAQQRAISPTDAFCDGTARIARGVQPVWPNF